MMVNERVASKSASTKSGVFRRNAPSRCRKDVICHLSMRQGTLSNRANPTTFEDEAELITDLVTGGTMKTKPFTAVHEVTRIGSEGYTVETWLEGAR